MKIIVCFLLLVVFANAIPLLMKREQSEDIVKEFEFLFTKYGKELSKSEKQIVKTDVFLEKFVWINTFVLQKITEGQFKFFMSPISENGNSIDQFDLICVQLYLKDTFSHQVLFSENVSGSFDSYFVIVEK